MYQRFFQLDGSMTREYGGWAWGWRFVGNWSSCSEGA